MSDRFNLLPSSTAYLTAARTATRVFAQWLGALVERLDRGIVPYDGVEFVNLTAAQVSDPKNFLQAPSPNAGLGVATSRFDGWAICNGLNGTPDLNGKVIRLSTSGSGATGAVDLSGAGGYYELVPLMRLERL